MTIFHFQDFFSKEDSRVYPNFAAKCYICIIGFTKLFIPNLEHILNLIFLLLYIKELALLMREGPAFPRQ